MLEAVTSGLSTVISWIGTVISALVSESGQLGALLPLFAVGISISVVCSINLAEAERPNTAMCC